MPSFLKEMTKLRERESISMFVVENIYQAFFMSVVNKLPLLIHIEKDSIETFQKDLEDKISTKSILYLKLTLPKDQAQWKYLRQLYPADIPEEEPREIYLFNDRNYIFKTTFNQTSFEDLLNCLNDIHKEDSQMLVSSSSVSSSSKTNPTNNLIIIKPRSTQNRLTRQPIINHCKMKIKFFPTDQLFIRTVDPTDITLTQVRQWLETLVHRDLRFKEYQFIRLHPFHRYNDIDELKALSALDMNLNANLILTDISNGAFFKKNSLFKYEGIIRDKIVSFSHSSYSFCRHFLRRKEKRIGSKENRLGKVPSSLNLSNNSNRGNTTSQHNLHSNVHTLNDI